MASVNGYTRIRQLNRFLPTDVQVALFKSVGRNERVHVANFLLGDDYTKTESPYLPNGTARQIREMGGDMTHKKWCDKIRRLLADHGSLDNKDAKFKDSYTNVAYMMRFMSSYPIQVVNERFVNIVLNKCEDLMNEMAFLEDFEDKMRQNYHRYKTRGNVAKLHELDERRALREKVRREVTHCQLVYWEKQNDLVKAKCEAVMNLSPSGIVFTCLPSP